MSTSPPGKLEEQRRQRIAPLLQHGAIPEGERMQQRPVADEPAAHEEKGRARGVRRLVGAGQERAYAVAALFARSLRATRPRRGGRGRRARARRGRGGAADPGPPRRPPAAESARRDARAPRRSMASETFAFSVASDFRNLARAGVLKNRSRTSTCVPAGTPASRASVSMPASTVRRNPAAAAGSRVVSTSRDTAAIDGSASPRNPKVPSRHRSSAAAILEVACRRRARRASDGGMPEPSSTTRMSRRPPPSISTSMRRAPASMAFSTSSLTTDAGRSTTSPAAIWSASSGGSTRTFTPASAMGIVEELPRARLPARDYWRARCCTRSSLAPRTAASSACISMLARCSGRQRCRGREAVASPLVIRKTPPCGCRLITS